MPRPKRRVFGPLFYSTLVLAVLVTTFTGIVTYREDLHGWRKMRALTAALRSADPAESAWAVAGLPSMGPEIALPYLLEAARDPRGEVRVAAFRALVALRADPEATANLLVAATTDGLAEVRMVAATGLGRLIEQQGSTIWKVSGTPTLSASRRDAIREALRRLVFDESGGVQVAAVEALGALETDSATVADLTRAASDPDRAVRLASAKVLLKSNGSGDVTAARTLVALVGEPSVVLDRRPALEALGNAGPTARAEAAAALGALLAHDDPAVRDDALDCLANLGPPARAALPAIEALTKAKDVNLRALAGKAIVAIEGKESPKGVAVLIGMVLDAGLPRETRYFALESIREVNPAPLSRATPDLIRQLGDPAPTTRMLAHELLGSILYDIPAQIPGPAGGK